MRTVLTFESSAFNTSEPRPYFINPECYGDDVARWLGERLRAAGARADEAPGQEDFGWYFEYDVPEGRHGVVLGYRPPDGDALGTWIGWVERSRGLVGSLLGRRRHGIAPAALDALHRALTGAAEIRNVRWHHRADFDAGREAAGQPSPHSA